MNVSRDKLANIVIEAVASYYDTLPEDIFVRQTAPRVEMRDLILMLMIEFIPNITNKQLKPIMRKKDHTTIRHARERINNSMIVGRFRRLWLIKNDIERKIRLELVEYRDFKLSDNFSLSEFICKDFTPVTTVILMNLIEHCREILEPLRDIINEPIFITFDGGYRSPRRNAQIGGVDNSYHKRGMASDIYAKKTNAWRLQNIIYDHIKSDDLKDGGVGSYKYFTHLDNRGYHARWRD